MLSISLLLLLFPRLQDIKGILILIQTGEQFAVDLQLTNYFTLQKQ